jgi:hypothetical protein
VANNPAFAKKAGVPQSVGKEFSNADKGRKFKEGGDMNSMMKKGYASGGMPMKDGKPAFVGDGKGKMAKGGMAKGKMPAALAKHADMPASKAHKGLKAGGLAAGHKSANGIAKQGLTKGMQVKMARGGKTC